MKSASIKASEFLAKMIERCHDAGLETGEIRYKDWNVETDVYSGNNTVRLLVYFNAKGTLTPRVQGKKSALKEVVELQIHGDEPLHSAFLPSEVLSWIGVDESGKGDYYGPLVAAAVLVTPDSLLRLRPLMLRDSKELTPTGIAKAAAELQNICEHRFTTVTVMPEQYNEFMKRESFNKNSQHILAWMHARCIENLLERFPDVSDAISDKFAHDSVINRALLPRGKRITLHQHVRAEADPAVAAASILARNEFVKRMKQLENEAGCTLPLGASNEQAIITAGKHILTNGGKEALTHYAKLHFRTTAKVLQRWSTMDAFDM